jgi:hypothetical protein
MASTIQLKTGTGSAVPTSLTQGEVAINIDNGLIYYGSGSTNTRKQLESFTNITASGNISASGNLTVNNTTASGDISSSNTVQGFTGSFHYIKVTDNLEVDGDLTVGGTVTAQEFHTEFISSSIIFESGSTIFGNSADDTHTFSGSITASGNISSSGTVTANSIVGTLATAAQTNITSLGTLTTLTVDHITINSSTISDNNELILDAGDNIILDTEEDIIFKDDGTTRYIFNVDSTPEIDIVGDLIIDPSGGDVKFSGANINVEGHITASGNISASGTITADDGSGKQFTVRPNLYFFATNTSATTQTLHGSNAGDQEGSLPATNTTTITLSQQQNSHSSVFSLSSNRLTISRAGLYKFTYNAVIEINNGSGRAEGFCGLVQETSAGDVTLVNGSEARGYHRFKHDQGPSGVTFAATVIVNVAANSIYDLRFGQEDQSVAGAQLRTLPSGTAITVEAIT